MAASSSPLFAAVCDVLPVAWLFNWTGLRWGLKAWVAWEILFFIVLRFVIWAQLEKRHPPLPNLRDPQESLSKVIATIARLQKKKAYSFQTFFEGWFRGAKLCSDIKEGNVREFLAWTTYHVKPSELSDQQTHVLDDALSQLKEKHGVSFESGYNPHISYVKGNLDTMKYSHRPFTLYVMVKLFQLLADVYLLSVGYSRHYSNYGVKYWYKPQPGRPSSHQPPLVFFHGMSPGLCLYLPFLTCLTRHRASVVMEIPHITTILNFHASRREILVRAVEEVAARHRFSRGMVVAGHSFGTIYAGWIQRAMPAMVKQIVLIDPVCLLLSLPDTVNNVLFHTPPSLLGRMFKLCFIISQDITVSYSIHRDFWWYRNMMWLEDLQCPVTIALSEQDSILPVEAILAETRMMTTNRQRGRPGQQEEEEEEEGSIKLDQDVRVVMWKEFVHGQVLLDSAAQVEVRSCIEDQLAGIEPPPWNHPHTARFA